MAGLPVLGEKFNPFTRQSSEPWVLANDSSAIRLKEVGLKAKEIDKDLNVLPVIHPRDPCRRPNMRSTCSSCAAAS